MLGASMSGAAFVLLVVKRKNKKAASKRTKREHTTRYLRSVDPSRATDCVRSSLADEDESVEAKRIRMERGQRCFSRPPALDNAYYTLALYSMSALSHVFRCPSSGGGATRTNDDDDVASAIRASGLVA